MAFILDEQQQQYKYFCKICKKGFWCGRALGGHMGAHGIGDESGHIYEDDDQEPAASDWEENGNNTKLIAANIVPVPPTNRRMYALRTNPNRLKSCRVCKNCGKEFLSWKSFLKHGNGKCSCDDQTFLVSSPESNGDDDDDDNAVLARRGCGNWFKRKRSFRAKVGNFNYSNNCPSSEEEELANCLMMLSNAAATAADDHQPEESCAWASKVEAEKRNINTMNFINHAPISSRIPVEYDQKKKANNGTLVGKGLFECKACKKVFPSHQALGGHRASHKKVKGCFAARLDQINHDHDVITDHEEFIFSAKSQFDQGTSSSIPLKRKSKVHECSICYRVFSSGQALGGHKRCHWLTSNNNSVLDSTTSALAKFQKLDQNHRVEQIRHEFIDNSEPLDLNLDLNLPAPQTPDHQVNPSTEIYIQSWIGVDAKDKKYNNNIDDGQQKYPTDIVDDEADSKVKLAKLSELKEMNMSCEGSSPWLQVGIGSTTALGADP